MAERVIPLVDQRLTALRAALPAQPVAATGLVADTLGRPLRDLRISVTDRCNFRCSYCMPKEIFDKDYRYLPHSSLLSFEEITRVARQPDRLRRQAIAAAEVAAVGDAEADLAHLAAEAVDERHGRHLPRIRT